MIKTWRPAHWIQPVEAGRQSSISETLPSSGSPSQSLRGMQCLPPCHGSAARAAVVGRGDHEPEGPPGTNMLSPTQLLYKIFLH